MRVSRSNLYANHNLYAFPPRAISKRLKLRRFGHQKFRNNTKREKGKGLYN